MVKYFILVAFVFTACTSQQSCDRKIEELFQEEDIDYFKISYESRYNFYLINEEIYSCGEYANEVINKLSLYNKRQIIKKEKPIKLFKDLPPKKPPEIYIRKEAFNKYKEKVKKDCVCF